jgi:integrative and conjugative element protein (TIGR02256 family)
MSTDGILLIPGDAFSSEPSEKPFRIISLRFPVRCDESGEILWFCLECPAREHGVMHRRPQTLDELVGMLEPEAVDLLSELRVWLRDRFTASERFLGANLVLLISFPRTRVAGGPVESPNLFAFQTRLQVNNGSIPAPIGVIGQSIGLLDRYREKFFLSALLDESKHGEGVLVEILNPHIGMTPKTLAIQNGRDTGGGEPKLCAVGVGALGSQVVMNLARAGFGRWTLIDHDLLLPHNVARHVLSGDFVGMFKCHAVARLANSLTDGEDVFQAIPASIFTTGEQEEDVREALDSADAILDMSASVSVARHLASAESRTGRCLSVFMSPTGADLVLLAEDEDRLLPLDELEMQYYRACVRDERLAGHLAASQSRLRYGQSCRDLTSQMPQRLVALHAGIAATAIPSILAKPDARVAVWRSLEDGSVSCVEVATSEAIRLPIGDWTVVTDDGLLSKLHGLRQKKLPNETGGVLLGSFDLDRRVVYIVDTIPSPPDSKEWPRLYVRGRDGLQPQVDQVKIATDGMLEYIGEWHSHPSGVLPIPSTADQAVFAWITKLTDAEGLPAVMMIVGDVGRVSCFVDEIAVRESLLPYGGAA